MKKAGLYLGIVLFSIAGNLWIFQSENVQAMQILVTSSFGGLSIGRGTVIEFTIKSAPLLFFQLLRTIICYEKLSRAGVYVFTRCPDKRKRTAGILAETALSSILYSAIWQGTGLVMGFIAGMSVPGVSFWETFFLQIMTLAGWMMLFTVIGFHVCVFCGSMPGIFAGMIPQFVIISSMQLFANGSVFSIDVSDPGFDPSHFDILKLHPFSQLVLDWHSSSIPELAGYMNYYQVFFPLLPGMVMFWILVAIVGIFLIGNINKMELYSVRT
ncbi:MAG: hypothetical protein K6F92_03695 [Lachnospiraceae bacterium]|nr:hypothetical protein [Lachnospiraceae bacterium]